MRHAIMVMGFGNQAKVLQKTINILDSFNIDFFIHWDKKYKLPKLYAKYSKIIFIPRIKVNWATDTQITAEKMLMKSVMTNKNHYDYVHLISSTDMPLMTSDYFQSFFKKNTYYLGFVDYIENFKYKRMQYYYPIRHFNVKPNSNNAHKGYIIIRLCVLLNKFMKINRLKGIHVEHGCNWFSMDSKYIKYILNFNHFNIFKNTFCGDEFYVQTILQKLKPRKLDNKYDYYSDEYRMTKSSEMAARYINWFKGNPYVFTNSDIHELKTKVNTKYAFARKIYDSSLIDKVFI